MLIAIEALEGGTTLTCTDQRPRYGKLNVEVQSLKDRILVFLAARYVLVEWYPALLLMCISARFCCSMANPSFIVAFDLPVYTASIHPNYIYFLSFERSELDGK